MSEQKAEYKVDESIIDELAEANELIKRYPSVTIEPPRKTMERNECRYFDEVKHPAWIKFSTAFKKEMKDIKPNALRVWIYIALSVDYNGTAYPGVRTIADALGVSHQTVLTATAELETLGLLTVTRGMKKHNFYHVSDDFVTIGKGKEPVQKLDSSGDMSQENNPMSQSYTPDESSPLDLNKKEQEVNKNNKNSLKKDIASRGGLGWGIALDLPSEELARLSETENSIKERTDEYERAMGYSPLSWGSKDLEPLAKFLSKQTPEDIRSFAEWSKNPYNGLSPAKARQFPRLVIDLWPQACPPEPVFGRVYKEPEPEQEWADLTKLRDLEEL